MEPFENLPEYEPKKNRDIKISLSDLYFLFNNIFCMSAEHLEEISDEEYKEISLLFNKYLVSSKLRDEEAFWYDAVKKLDASAPDMLNQEDYQSRRRSAFEFYIKAKHNRESLQKEIDNCQTS